MLVSEGIQNNQSRVHLGREMKSLEFKENAWFFDLSNLHIWYLKGGEWIYHRLDSNITDSHE